MKMFMPVFFVMAMFLGTAQALEIPGYIGVQSFELDENTPESVIYEIKKINKEGAGIGHSDGRMDGRDLAISMMETGNTTYPGDFQGPNFKPKINHANVIMEKAFADGYVYDYHKFARLEFKRVVQEGRPQGF